VTKLLIFEWGVDSAENVTEDLFQCIISNFGYPRFWGRYLVRVPNVSEGLTEQEISFIHSKGIKILPIYNELQETTGYRQGISDANNAVSHAHRLGIPRGVPLFADIEQYFSIDNEWIQGWTEAITSSGYKSGIYNDPVSGDFNEAFCNAVKENKKIKTLNILWSAQPELNLSNPRNRPYYTPKAPNCGGNVWAWQYSRDVGLCPIDTNLAINSLVSILW